MTIPTGFGQATLLFGGGALPTGAACTIGFENSTPLTAQVAADEISTNWVSNVNGLLSSGVTFLGVMVKLGPDATGPSAVSSASVAGSDAATTTPPNVAILVRKVTLLGGRRGRGRMFVPGLDESDVGPSGVIAGAKVTALQTAFNTFALGMVSDGLDPMLLHGDNGTPTAIDTLAVDTVVATQRRRLRR